MIRIEYREPEAADLKVTGSAGRVLLGHLAFSLTVCAGLGALTYAVSKSVIAAIIIGGGLFVPSLVSNLRFFVELRQRERMMGDTTAVEVISVNASRVVEIQPIGTGEAYVFFAGPGQAILVNGQWQLEYKPFPAASFRISRWADSKDPIRIEISGEYIFPEESDVTVRPNYTVGDIELFTAYPDTLQQDMDAAFAKAEK